MLPKLKILVVERERDMLRQWETTLKTMGLAPRCLASSQKAATETMSENGDEATSPAAICDHSIPHASNQAKTSYLPPGVRRRADGRSRLPPPASRPVTDLTSIAAVITSV